MSEELSDQINTCEVIIPIPSRMWIQESSAGWLSERKRSKNLENSWKPFINLLYHLGIKCRNSELMPTSSWHVLITIIFLLNTIGGHSIDCVITASALLQNYSSSNPQTLTMMLSVMFDTVSVALHSVGIHLALIVFSRRHWTDLHRSFLQAANELNNKLFPELKKIAVRSACLVTLLVSS